MLRFDGWLDGRLRADGERRRCSAGGEDEEVPRRFLGLEARLAERGRGARGLRATVLCVLRLRERWRRLRERDLLAVPRGMAVK